MSRDPVSIVILAWNSWETTRACLDSLRPTLGVRDQVIVVDNGSTDQTPAGLRMYPWVEVVTNAENRGFAGGCNDGAAVATTGLLVFLNNDTVLANGWIDPLAAAFDDPTVGAAGPRSNFVSGPQVVERANYVTHSEMRRFAREWMTTHRHKVTHVERLVGFCLALRRDVFERIGGFDEGYGIGGFEDDDLCARVMSEGLSLVIVHGSFVHHEGHKTFDANGLDWLAEQESNRQRFMKAHKKVDRAPLVSACLITKDEQDQIEGCLASLAGVADEIVVYDTGSTDDTVALARAAGATVIEGYWDDDFSRARNASLEHCKGDWIVWLDADETLQAEKPGQLRSLLARTKPEVDAWSIRIQNLTGSGAGTDFSHHAARIFRRPRCDWTGRLHEQITRRGTHAPIHQAEMDDTCWIRHTGYTDQMMAARNKAERNLRLAQVEVDRADGWDIGYSLTSLSRSLLLNGRAEDALDKASEALRRTDNGITRRMAVRSGIEALLSLGRYDEALEWCRTLEAEGADTNLVLSFEATTLSHMERWQEAVELIDRITPDVSDFDGFSVPLGQVAGMRATALAALDRRGEAADSLLQALSADGVLDTHLGTLVDHLRHEGRSLLEVARAIPVERAVLFFAQVRQLTPEVADETLEATLEVPGLATHALATAAGVAANLPIERALVWSARLRQAGYSDFCPLVAIARSPQSPLVRARAAATAAAAFSEPKAADLLQAAFVEAAPSEQEVIRAEVAQFGPAVAGLLPDPSAPARTTSRLRASVVIPLFNRADMTLQCLNSLAQHTAAGSFEVILVDNGSTDQTAQMSAGGDGWFRLIRNEKNLGYARACNQGAAAARSDTLVFLNNDIVVSPGWLPALIRPLEENPDVAIVGARLLFPDGTIQHGGVDLTVSVDNRLHGLHRFYRLPGDTPAAALPARVDAVTGAALAISRDTFKRAGRFNEAYWNGNEDMELCLTVAEQGGWILYEPACTLVHFESQSGPERFTRVNANIELFTDRWLDKFRSGLLSTSAA